MDDKIAGTIHSVAAQQNANSCRFFSRNRCPQLNLRQMLVTLSSCRRFPLPSRVFLSPGLQPTVFSGKVSRLFYSTIIINAVMSTARQRPLSQTSSRPCSAQSESIPCSQIHLSIYQTFCLALLSSPSNATWLLGQSTFCPPLLPPQGVKCQVSGANLSDFNAFLS